MTRPQLELLKFVKNVAAHGPTEDLLGGPELPGGIPSITRTKVAPGATGVRSPLDDYREFFEFDIEIPRGRPTDQGTGLSAPLASGRSRLRQRTPRAALRHCRCGFGLAYRLDRGNKDGLRLMLLDEAFNRWTQQTSIANDALPGGAGVCRCSPARREPYIPDSVLHRYYMTSYATSTTTQS